MDRSKPSQATAFNTLPIELNKEIAHHLHDHRDIANYKAICRATRDAIDGDSFSFWRAKFCKDFARPPNRTNAQLCRLYKDRWRYLRRFVALKGAARYQFFHGHSTREQAVVRILKDLIIESFTATGTHCGEQHQCPNMVRLKQFVMQSRLLLGGKRPPPPIDDKPACVSDSLAAVRLMATHFLFDQVTPPGSWFAIDDAQKAVYAATNMAPLYLGPKKNTLNMDWVLQCLNFFRYYMTTPDASLMCEAMDDLDESQKPSAWREPLKSGSYPLSSHWKGTYAFLDHHDLARFRRYTNSKQDYDRIFTDLNVDEGKIQSLYLDFSTDGNTMTWPAIFEDRLHSLRDTDKMQMRAQHSKKTGATDDTNTNIRFDGWGEDLEDHFYATGWLNPLPAQCDIPGWQRVTFMKHFEDDINSIDRDNLWAYEGVVLPGGRIMLGRWWFASDDDVDFDNDYGGPFIFWAVEPEPEVEGDGDDDDDE